MRDDIRSSVLDIFRVHLKMESTYSISMPKQLETVISALLDEFPVFRTSKKVGRFHLNMSILFRIGICTLGFLLGLPQVLFRRDLYIHVGPFYLVGLSSLHPLIRQCSSQNMTLAPEGQSWTFRGTNSYLRPLIRPPHARRSRREAFTY